MGNRLRVMLNFVGCFLGCLLTGAAYSHHEAVATQASMGGEQVALLIASAIAVAAVVAFVRRFSVR